MVIGLVGVLPIALGMIIFGGDGQSATPSSLVKDAEAKVAKNPTDISALVSLSAQYKSVGRNKDAADTLKKAVTIGPKTVDELRLIVGAYGTDTAKQSEVIKAFTKTHPKSAEGWLLAGTVASNTGDTLGARLAYQKVLDLANASSSLGKSAQAGLDQLAAQTATQIVPTTPTTK